jgi:hypothetical protein
MSSAPLPPQDREMLQLHNNALLNAAMQKTQACGSATNNALKALWK